MMKLSVQSFHSTFARTALLFGTALLLSGCSTYITVTSEPEGARITDPSGTVNYGIAPVSVEYDTSELEGQQGMVPGFKATWVSGATAETENPFIITDLKYGANVLLKRPANAPGLEKDLEFALKRAQQRAKQAEAERDQMQLYLNDSWFWGPRWGWGWGMGVGF